MIKKIFRSRGVSSVCFSTFLWFISGVLFPQSPFLNDAYAQRSGTASAEDLFCKSKLPGTVSLKTCSAACPGGEKDCAKIQTFKKETYPELSKNLDCYGCTSEVSCYDMGLIYPFADCPVCEANPFKKCVDTLSAPLGMSIPLPKDSDGTQCWDCIDDPDTCKNHWPGSSEKAACLANCTAKHHKCVFVGNNPDNGYDCYRCKDSTPPKSCKDLGFRYQKDCGTCPPQTPKCEPATTVNWLSAQYLPAKDEQGRRCYECVKAPKTCEQQGLKSKCAADEIPTPVTAPNGAKCVNCAKKPKTCADYKMQDPKCQCKPGEIPRTKRLPKGTGRETIECCSCDPNICHPDLMREQCKDCEAKGGKCEPITHERGKPQCYRCVIPKKVKTCSDLDKPADCGQMKCYAGEHCVMADSGYGFPCPSCEPDDTQPPPQDQCEDHPTHKMFSCAPCYQASMACDQIKVSDNPEKWCAKCLPPVDERCPKPAIEGSCASPWCVDDLKCVDADIPDKQCHYCVEPETCAPQRYRTRDCDQKCNPNTETCQRIEGCEYAYGEDPRDVQLAEQMDPEDKYCGPDMTSVLLESLNCIRLRAGNLSDDEKGVIDGTMFLNNNGMNIDLRAKDVVNAQGETVCPTKPCKAGTMKTIGLCGQCVMYHIANDMLYGFISNQLDVPWHIQLAGAHYAEYTSYGGLDPLSSQAAYAMGNDVSEAMKKNPQVSIGELCSILNASTLKTAAFTATNGFEIMGKEQGFLKDCRPCLVPGEALKDWSQSDWKLEDGGSSTYQDPGEKPEYCCYHCVPKESPPPECEDSETGACGSDGTTPCSEGYHCIPVGNDCHLCTPKSCTDEGFKPVGGCLSGEECKPVSTPTGLECCDCVGKSSKCQDAFEPNHHCNDMCDPDGEECLPIYGNDFGCEDCFGKPGIQYPLCDPQLGLFDPNQDCNGTCSETQECRRLPYSDAACETCFEKEKTDCQGDGVKFGQGACPQPCPEFYECANRSMYGKLCHECVPLSKPPFGCHPEEGELYGPCPSSGSCHDGAPCTDLENGCHTCADKVYIEDSSCIEELGELPAGCNNTCKNNEKCAPIEGHDAGCHHCVPKQHCNDLTPKQLTQDQCKEACSYDPVAGCKPQGYDDFGNRCYICDKPKNIFCEETNPLYHSDPECNGQCAPNGCLPAEKIQTGPYGEIQCYQCGAPYCDDRKGEWQPGKNCYGKCAENQECKPIPGHDYNCEACQDIDSGGCQSDADCDDGDACTADTCDPETKACSNAPVECPQGQGCNPETGECLGDRSKQSCYYSQQQDGPCPKPDPCAKDGSSAYCITTGEAPDQCHYCQVDTRSACEKGELLDGGCPGECPIDEDHDCDPITLRTGERCHQCTVRGIECFEGWSPGLCSKVECPNGMTCVNEGYCYRCIPSSQLTECKDFDGAKEGPCPGNCRPEPFEVCIPIYFDDQSCHFCDSREAVAYSCEDLDYYYDTEVYPGGCSGRCWRGLEDCEEIHDQGALCHYCIPKRKFSVWIIRYIETPLGRHILREDSGNDSGFQPASIMALAKAEKLDADTLLSASGILSGIPSFGSLEDIAALLQDGLVRQRKFTQNCFKDLPAGSAQALVPDNSVPEDTGGKKAKKKKKNAEDQTKTLPRQDLKKLLKTDSAYGYDPITHAQIDGPIVACGTQDGENALVIMDSSGATVETILKEELKANPNALAEAIVKAGRLSENSQSLARQIQNVQQLNIQDVAKTAGKMLMQKIVSGDNGKNDIIPDDPFYYFQKKKKKKLLGIFGGSANPPKLASMGLGGLGASSESVRAQKKTEVKDQWGIQRIGYLPRDNESSAWNIVDGLQKNILVAVVDSGLDTSHEDGPAYVWTNDGEIPDNGKDDDGNGFIDDVHGWNFVNENHDLTDENGHGTFVAGIIAAKRNNGLGIAGINPGAVIMPVKVVNSEGETNQLLIYQGIRYAVQNGARVINLSLGGTIQSEVEQAALNYARAHKVFVSVASGNNGWDMSDVGPAGERNAFAVGAIDLDGLRSTISSEGPNNALLAPGELIYSLRSKDSFDKRAIKDPVHRLYFPQSGTSFAAPMVTATASLMLVKNPQLTPEQIEDILEGTATDMDDPGWDGKTGFGLLNASDALKRTDEDFLNVKITRFRINWNDRKKLESVDVFATVRGKGLKNFVVGVGKGKRARRFKDVAGPFTEQADQAWVTRIDKDKLRGSKYWMVEVKAVDENGQTKTAQALLDFNR